MRSIVYAAFFKRSNNYRTITPNSSTATRTGSISSCQANRFFHPSEVGFWSLSDEIKSEAEGDAGVKAAIDEMNAAFSSLTDQVESLRYI